MLIRDATLRDGARVDVRLEGRQIVEIGVDLSATAHETRVDAQGGLLLPGLHDHHLHLRALAAAQASVRCGPPQVNTRDQLAAALAAAAARYPGSGWLRGIGYHPSVAGELSRAALDALMPDRPLRIQHRSGRLWVLNSAALAALAPADDAPLEREGGRWSGRLYDADDWLRGRMRSAVPDLTAVSRALAAHGITGVTDAGHHNDRDTLADFVQAQARGTLLQNLRLMGGAQLDGAADHARVQVGEHKFHLHDHDLPDFDGLVAALARSHAHGRGAAFHCVTEGELVFALAALREAGVHPDDRIEHASIAPPALVDDIVALGLTVVTQPAFIAERGDAYLRDVAPQQQPWLYRLRSWLDAGVPLALSSDAPYTDPDPWAAIRAAMTRRSLGGAVLGAAEALDFDHALDAYLAPLECPRAAPRVVAVGAAADLCLLAPPSVADPLGMAPRVRQTWICGQPQLTPAP